MDLSVKIKYEAFGGYIRVNKKYSKWAIFEEEDK